ncbi:MAG: hypothetical protein ABH828_01320 [archaeon]
MKKFLLLMIIILNVGMVYGACGGAGAVNGVQGENLVLTAPNPVIGSGVSWSIVSPSTYPSGSAFSGASGCDVTFNAVNDGVFIVQASDAGGTSQITVTLANYLTTYGFGHQCYSVNTGNCGDIESYGDVTASGLMSADNVFAFSWMHSFGDVKIGNFTAPAVILSATGVTLPATAITGGLSATGAVSAASASVTGNVNAGKFIGPIDLKNCANPPKIYSNNNDIVVEIGSC